MSVLHSRENKRLMRENERLVRENKRLRLLLLGTEQRAIAAERAIAAAAQGPDLALTTEWSRPRQISRVLAEQGFSVPQRLRASLFDELIRRLHAHGVELMVVGAVRESGTPGIAAKVRLRLSPTRHP